MKGIANRDVFIELLVKAKEDGALSMFQDKELRDIRISSFDGCDFKIIWYTNLSTLTAPGFSVWFDDARIETSHPAFKVALVLYRNGIEIVHIGKQIRSFS